MKKDRDYMSMTIKGKKKLINEFKKVCKDNCLNQSALIRECMEGVIDKFGKKEKNE